MRAFVVVLALFAAPAVALPDPGPLRKMVVRGTRSGYVDVTFEREFHVDTYDFDTRVLNGRIGGFWAERLRQPAEETPDRFAIIHIRHQGERLTSRVVRAAGKPGETGHYRPGTYRFHVVADGAFELSIPVLGLGQGLVVAPRRFTARPRLTVVDGTPATANTAWEARERITVGGVRSVAVSMSSLRWSGSGTQQHVLCFAAPGADCAEDKRHVAHGTSNVAVAGQHRTVESYFAAPGLLTRGTWDAYQRSVTAPGPNFTVMHGMALVFEAPL